jgi:hypothetical protein
MEIVVLILVVLAIGYAMGRRGRLGEPRYGLDSFPAPPPVACRCPESHFEKMMLSGARHVEPCPFAGTPGGDFKD